MERSRREDAVEQSTRTREGPLAGPRLPERIGRYHVKRVIAAGGMGTVYEATQESPRRVVAVKVMKQGIASRSALRRFEYEGQILGRLRHPGIAQIYEAGVHVGDPRASGHTDLQTHVHEPSRDREGAVVDAVPFFAMEYIPNARPITAYAKEKKLGIRERMGLFAQVCDAVHHGHQKGIIHRDLKPSNILVDSHGQVKIIDFGVARSTDSDLAVTTLQTDVGQLIGTLQYMSPEQCEADPHDIDIRSDVYALGVVFYELLCEKPPYDVRGMAIHLATRVIREQDPTKLSTVNRTLRGDVETVALKALEKERARRYQSAADFGQDIDRYLANRPIQARPPSAIYQLRVFARRNKALCAAAAVVLVVLSTGLVGTGYGLVQANRARQEADAQRRLAELREAEALAARRAEEERAIQAERQSYLANIAAATAALADEEIASAKRRLDACPPHLRNWEWGFLLRQTDTSALTLRADEYDEYDDPWNRGLYSAAFSPDGAQIITGGKNVRLWDAATGTELRVPVRGLPRDARATLSPDGRRILTVTNRSVRIWDAATGAELLVLHDEHRTTLPHAEILASAAFSPDGNRIVTRTHGWAHVWDATTGEQLHVLRARVQSVTSVSFSPDGSRLLSASLDDTASLLDIETGKRVLVLRGHQEGVLSASFNSDGTRIVTASRDNTARVWDAATGAELLVLRGHADNVRSAVFSPDGARIATASADNTARLWDATTGEGLSIYRGHDDGLRVVAFNPDGTRLVTSSVDRTVRVWNVAMRPEGLVLRGHDGWVSTAMFSHDGRRIVTASQDTTARVWDTTTGRQLITFRGHKATVTFAAFNPDGTRIVSASLDDTVRVWDAASGSELLVLNVPVSMGSAGTPSALFSPDGKRILTASNKRKAHLWDAETGAEILVLRGHKTAVSSAVFSRDGTLIATASSDNSIRLWDAMSGTAVRVFDVNRDAPVRGVNNGLGFSPDSTRVVTNSWDNTAQSLSAARVWNVATGEELIELRGHSGWLTWSAFSPDGTRIVTSSADKTVRVWDAATGAELIVLRGHDESVSSVDFSPDGSQIATASSDKTCRVWDAGRAWRLGRGTP